ncbi:MAG: protoheme IX farnesyltransferase [Rhodospirillales bacterium RIFCSPLOWO2_12_FULL_58_28]|nr:MAG: protoheme IX farnesyltransferase [Rhodospirillales bacterium RIFCSPLOWO2_02_FULL_58_16]OHC78343.1 MAG: protoheme IX farnesyltransferase [Rhodospirillales bacterium RIFCSPLOWO2_12_FULL_58_28]
MKSPEDVAAFARVRDYAVLLKPRVMSLVVFSGVAGLYMAPGKLDLWTALNAILYIAIGAGGSGAVNMWYDRDIDLEMSRTKNRPVPAGRMAPSHALWVGTVLSVLSVAAMTMLVNKAAAALLALTIVYYVFIYTMWLKRRTPQNIVIGGASGAFPPMIGWAAVTGSVDIGSIALFAIIFIWTPPHFWALALYRCSDYAKAGVPMLPVVSGVRATKKQILAYSVLLVPVTLMPVYLGMAGIFYGAAALALDGWLLRHALRVWGDESEIQEATAKPMFLYSILYLFLIFVFMMADKAFFQSI